MEQSLTPNPQLDKPKPLKKELVVIRGTCEAQGSLGSDR